MNMVTGTDVLSCNPDNLAVPKNQLPCMNIVQGNFVTWRNKAIGHQIAYSERRPLVQLP